VSKVALIALALLYTPVVLELAGVWWRVSYFNYGFLIPAFSAWLVWESRDALARAATLARWWPGLGIVVAGLGALGAGFGVDSQMLRALSMPVVVAGLGLHALGPAGFRPFAFPTAFLVFMTPLPDPAIAKISLPLQQLAASVATVALNAIGIRAVQDGLYVALPTVVLHVEESCNGLRFLLAMLVVGVAFGWMTQRTTARRLGVVAVAVVAAIVANLLRVTGTGVVAHHFGRDAATGVAHLVYGKVVYLVMMVPFVTTVLLLRRGTGSPAHEEVPGRQQVLEVLLARLRVHLPPRARRARPRRAPRADPGRP
jgi:exosortase